MIFVLVEVLISPSARAEETCRTLCWETYGACYKSTSNRQHCQGRLLRCLSNCIRAKRKSTSTHPAAPRSLTAPSLLPR
jgi:hypothetical protein